jgi:hypothetical protein
MFESNWAYVTTMVILEHVFPKKLHNMVNYNTNNLIANNFFLTYIVQFQNIFVAKKCMSLSTKKWKYTQKMIEMIFSHYEIFNIY